MLRTILFSLWACSVTAGMLFFGLSNSADSNSVEIQESQVKKEPTFSQPLMVYVPVLSKSDVTGFLFSNVSVLADSKLLDETGLPLDMLIQDSYLTFLAGNKEYALPDIEKFDDQKLKLNVKKHINAVVGKQLVEAVYMSDINFLEIEEVRGQSKLKPNKKDG